MIEDGLEAHVARELRAFDDLHSLHPFGIHVGARDEDAGRYQHAERHGTASEKPSMIRMQ
ncbi:hypothetical protein D3C83_162620 [compost metagenome]